MIATIGKVIEQPGSLTIQTAAQSVQSNGVRRGR